jgi:hypothetical protein
MGSRSLEETQAALATTERVLVSLVNLRRWSLRRDPRAGQKFTRFSSEHRKASVCLDLSLNCAAQVWPDTPIGASSQSRTETKRA